MFLVEILPQSLKSFWEIMFKNVWFWIYYLICSTRDVELSSYVLGVGYGLLTIGELILLLQNGVFLWNQDSICAKEKKSISLNPESRRPP